MYHEGGQPILEKYLVNPKIKVTPLRVPPRNADDDIDCEWELKDRVEHLWGDAVGTHGGIALSS